MPLLSALAITLLTFLFQAIVPLIVRLLAGLGVGYVVFTGVSAINTAAQTYVMTQYSGIPAAALQLANMSGGSVAINMIFAAYGARVSIKIAMGVFERFTLSKAGRN